jgi:ribosome biogenesis protein MAK21
LFRLKVDHEQIDSNLNTLFKLVHITSFNISIQVMMLLNQVVSTREDLVHRYYNALYRRMFDLEWKTTSKETYFLNLLYNSIIKDDAIPRIKAFVKRLLQVNFSQNVPFVCGSFMLCSELLKSTNKNIFQVDHAMLVENTILNDGDDDEEEHFVDAADSDSDSQSKKVDSSDSNDSGLEDEKKKKTKKSLTNKNNSWVHKKNVIFKHHDKYDYTQRNPLYCGADKTLTYELLPFTRHYHPTVALFAQKLLKVTLIVFFKSLPSLITFFTL